MTATNKTGVFSLEKITDRQSNNKWSTILDPYIFNTTSVGTDFGYFGGGYNPSRVQSGINRIDYSSDTSTGLQKGNFQTYTYGHRSACGTGNYGYFAGGPGAGTRIERIDYANDTATASPKGP